jgi:hypothetical protein
MRRKKVNEHTRDHNDLSSSHIIEALMWAISAKIREPLGPASPPLSAICKA